MFNDNAPVMNHQFSLTGGSERVNYFMSLGYYTQEGIGNRVAHFLIVAECGGNHNETTVGTVHGHIDYLRNGQGQTFSSVWSSKNEGLVWQLENVLSYDKTIGERKGSFMMFQPTDTEGKVAQWLLEPKRLEPSRSPHSSPTPTSAGKNPGRPT